MTKPSIHLNGTSRELLIFQYINAAQAVRDAIDVLCQNGPHGRDYYPQSRERGGPTAYESARDEHIKRVQALRAVAQELEDLAQHCADAK